MSIVIGRCQRLFIQRFTQNGAYLTPSSIGIQRQNLPVDTPKEVLLPNKFLQESMQIGDELEVFVLTDSQDRPVATTQTPKAQCGEIAVLEVLSIESQGCFLDLGLDKHIFMPSKAPHRFKIHQKVVVAIMLDRQSRLIAKLGIKSHLEMLNQMAHIYNPPPLYAICKALVFEKTPLGFGCVLKPQPLLESPQKVCAFSQGGFYGLLYHSELPSGFQPSVGLEIDVRVKKVRADQKLDVCLAPNENEQKQRILDSMPLKLDFSSSPESIFEMFQMSKKMFKRLINELSREGKVEFHAQEKAFKRTTAS